MAIKAVICDLDGTLLNTHHLISDYTKEVIKKVVAKGIKVYIATGRHHIDARKFMEVLGIKSFLISSNGAKVHNTLNEEVFSIDIPSDLTTAIVNLSIDEDIHKNIFTTDGWFVEKPLDDIEQICKETGFGHKVVPSFKEFENRDIIKMFFSSDNLEKMTLLYNEISSTLGEKITVTLPSKYMEIMANGVSKGEAIKKMLELEGITLEEAIAFGDGTNDIEMLSVVGKGYIMGNADAHLKRLVPQGELIETNDNEGVAKKLAELFL